MDNPQDITVLSLCSGYGGLELGLARALANPLRVVAVEIEAYALANLVAKAEEGKLAVESLWPDLRTFSAERFRGCFDFVLAGYPCQPFSVAGKRQGADDPRHLWPAIARIVAAVEPLWCFFENVPGHLSLGFPDVYCSLRDMGYKVEAGLFSAAECGAPHKRERLFILAHHRPTNDTARMQSETVSNRSGQLADAERPGARPGILQEAQAGIGRDRLAEQRPVVADDPGSGLQAAQSKQTRQSALEPSRDKWPARPGQPQYEWEEPRVVGDAGSRLSGRQRREIETITEGQGNTNRQWPDGANIVDGAVGSPKEQTESGMGGKSDGIAGGLDRNESGDLNDDTEIRGNQSTRESTRIPKRPPGREENAESTDADKIESPLHTEASGFPGRGEAGQHGGGESIRYRLRVDRLRLLGNGVVPQQAERAFRELFSYFEPVGGKGGE